MDQGDEVTMDIHEITDFDSESCDSVEEDDDVEDVDDVLNFWNKVTKELNSCFKKNIGSEEFCDDIYENRVSIPRSGCYSYYADILAVAQMSDVRNTADANSKKDLDQKNSFGDTAIYPCTWKCTGQWNPAVGTGPFEELFQVLNWSEFTRLQNIDCSATYSSQYCAPNPCLPSNYDGDFIGYDSIENDYSPFTDIFYRWNNDSLTSLPTTNSNDFVSPDFQAFV